MVPQVGCVVQVQIHGSRKTVLTALVPFPPLSTVSNRYCGRRSVRDQVLQGSKAELLKHLQVLKGGVLDRGWMCTMEIPTHASEEDSYLFICLILICFSSLC